MSGWPGAADGAPAAPRLSTAASASVAGSDILLLSEPGVRDLAVRPVVADGREPVVQRRLELRLALPEAEPELLAGLFDKRDFYVAVGRERLRDREVDDDGVDVLVFEVLDREDVASVRAVVVLGDEPGSTRFDWT